MKRKISFISILAILIIFPLMVQAAPVGEFTHIEGRVDITSPGMKARPANPGDQIEVGDFIRTKSKSKAEVSLIDGTILRLAQSTRLRITEYIVEKDRKSRLMDLFRGKAQNIVKSLKKLAGCPDAARFEVHTPTAVCGVRGTNFFVFHQAGRSGAIFKEGEGYGYSRNVPGKVVTIKAGQMMMVVSADKPPTVRLATAVEIEQHTSDTAPSEKTEEEGEKEKVEEKAETSEMEAKAEEGEQEETSKEEASKDESAAEEGGEGKETVEAETTTEETAAEEKPAEDTGTATEETETAKAEEGPVEDTGGTATEDAGAAAEDAATEMEAAESTAPAEETTAETASTEETPSVDETYPEVLEVVTLVSQADEQSSEYSLYIDQSENAGILKYTTPVQIVESIGILPENLAENLLLSSGWYFGSAAGSFLLDDGTSVGNITIRQITRNDVSITDQTWGVSNALYKGTYEEYNNATYDNWSLLLDFWEGNTRHLDNYVGSKWSDGAVEAKGASAWVNWTDCITGVGGGEITGTFNASGYTWQADGRWTTMDTDKFFSMIDGQTDALTTLNIPCIEVGKATLTGTGNNMDIEMKNVTFFSYSTGTDPRIWATKNVTGTYSATPQTGVAVELNGGGLNANFNLGKWTGGKWGVNITGGSGTLTRTDNNGSIDIKFRGGAAGTYDNGNLSGTGAGTVNK